MQPRIMVAAIMVAFWMFTLAPGAALAQSGNTAPPAQIGNRANGFSYQPTPGQVGPREQAAGVAPSGEQQKQINDELFKLDAQSLKSEGLGTGSVPGHGDGK